MLLMIIHAILPPPKPKPKPEKLESVEKAKRDDESEDIGDNVDDRRGNSDKPELYKVYKGMSSPEKWEAKQLIASGVLSLRDYQGDGLLYQEEEEEEEEEGAEVEIEMNEDERAFLQGQSRYSS
nr:putative pre-mrna-splicing factor atp-dependent rna helicase deah5 [Quercus suber]